MSKKETSTPKKLRVCPNGHTYYKSSDCPVCPVCENVRKPQGGFLSLLSAPARRALENKGVTTLNKLAIYSEKEILALHGMGPASMPKLRKALKEIGLAFKKR
ncbi:MAG TPA: RNA polymerase alpha subunit C-terminal domain-containing protein [Bacteroidia bacterium]|jgi:predicted RecB family nuclease|nr:RNA polymerase alpha subunit C-terminal domain-containing protein [Bacteroidia bacterium]